MNKRQYMALVRNAAVTLGGIMAHRGAIRGDEVEQVISLAMIVAALAWSLHEKRDPPSPRLRRASRMGNDE